MRMELFHPAGSDPPEARTMAEGYFELPLSTNSMAQYNEGRVFREDYASFQGSDISSLPSPNGNASLLDTRGEQTKPKNAGMLKTTNGITSNNSASEQNQEHRRPLPASDGHSDEGIAAPQKPYAAIDILPDEPGNNAVDLPRASDSSFIFSDDGGLAGSTPPAPCSIPGVMGEDGYDDKLTSQNDLAGYRQPPFSSLQPHSFWFLSRNNRFPALKSARSPSSVSSSTLIGSDYGDEIRLITLIETLQPPLDDEEGRPVERDRARRHLSGSSGGAHQPVQQQMTDRNTTNPFTRLVAFQSRSGRVTTAGDRATTATDPAVSSPALYRWGLLSQLLKLRHGAQQDPMPEPVPYPDNLHAGDDCITDEKDVHPDLDSLSQDSFSKLEQHRRWYGRSPNLSDTSLALSGTTAKSSLTGISGPPPSIKRSQSSDCVIDMTRKPASPVKKEPRFTVRSSEMAARQSYIVHLSQALMKFGAPTHRLEEALYMTARALSVQAHFFYVPGCMVISFEDPITHKTEAQLVKLTQGIDLGRLLIVHRIYKGVIHETIGVEEAIRRLEECMQRKPRFNVWVLIFLHGCASASVGPFAFGARPIDMPIAFCLGCVLGILQEVLSPRSCLYSNVFEVSAAMLTSFLARAFGSIPYKGGRLFCYSALAQSAIALILPGWIVLCGSLELQARNMVAGSVRMVYAIIYSLFLGFGITIGAVAYGLIDSNATSEYVCPPSPIPNPYLQRFPFVLAFTFFLATINQSQWRQIPMMLATSLCGYLANYFSFKRFGSNTQFANTLGAFVIGVMGNLYSRLFNGLAAAAILPAIWVQVPSGLAASGALVSGITSADEITSNRTFYSVINNGTQGFFDAQRNITFFGTNRLYGDMMFDIGYGMVQVAIGTTLGLFLAALVVYPFGKKNSGLFSF